jgi:hypothetical protein
MMKKMIETLDEGGLLVVILQSVYEHRVLLSGICL